MDTEVCDLVVPSQRVHILARNKHKIVAAARQYDAEPTHTIINSINKYIYAAILHV